MKANYAHELLTDFCQVRNEQNSLYGLENPLTNRVLFIVDTIIDLNLHKGLNLDVFEDKDDLYYVNVELTINAGTNDSVMFVAHHDVNNVNSDNCQDNSASVCNLLALAEHLSNDMLNKTVHIVFTDCEEFGGLGAKRLSERINNEEFGNVEYIVNLELTANGGNLWVDSGNFLTESPLLDKVIELNNDVMEAVTPFNDSVTFRANGIDSVCLGILNNDNIQQVFDKGKCNTWSICHKKRDTIEQAAANDMDDFVQKLIKFC